MLIVGGGGCSVPPFFQEELTGVCLEGLVRLVLSCGGEMSSPAGGGRLSTIGKRESSSLREMVRCARASFGRCFLWGVGTRIGQFNMRYTEERLIVRCLDESWAVKTDREGKEVRSLVAAELCGGRAQAILRAARY